MADIACQGAVASAHVDVVWDPARSPVEETAWLDALPRPLGIAARYVVASLDVAALLDAHAVSSCVVAVHKSIRWHQDPAKHWARQSIVHEPGWRRGLAQLGKHGWACDLMNPHQAEKMPALAREMPGQRWDATIMTVRKVLEMATIDGAHAVGLGYEIGPIEVGKKADLALVDPRSVIMSPIQDPVSTIVYSALGHETSLVVIDGRIVFRDGTVQTVDEHAVRSAVQNAAAGLAGRAAIASSAQAWASAPER